LNKLVVIAVKIEPDFTAFFANGFDMQAHQKLAASLVATRQRLEQLFVLFNRSGILCRFAMLEVEALGKVLDPRGNLEQDWAAARLVNQPMELDVEFKEPLVIPRVRGYELFL
jgi:hypothetical protein